MVNPSKKNFPGFIGDKIGYKAVMVACLAASAITQTTFLFLPPFHEYQQNPYAILVREGNSSDSTLEAEFNLLEIYWPLCPDEAAVSVDSCAASDPYQSEGFANISRYWSCPPNLDFNPDFVLNSPPNVTDLSNGTFCHATSAEEAPLYPDLAVICYISGRYAESCTGVEGDHALTFWLYFTFYCIYTMSMNSAFSLLDSTALQLANQHGSHYSYIMMWNILGSVFTPIVTGLAIDTPEEGGRDYKKAIFSQRKWEKKREKISVNILTAFQL